MKDLVRMLERVQPRCTGDVRAAREAWASVRERNGWGAVAPLLSPPSSNVKYAKTVAKVYGLSLAPDKSSGSHNVCRFSTPECRKGCVAFAGHGELAVVQRARAQKVEFLAAYPNEFVTLLDAEIHAAYKLHGQELRVRLNGFSDIPWESVSDVLVGNPNVLFYDYTKWPYGTRDVPSNYRLTYSVSERTTHDEIGWITDSGDNVAMVFDVKRGDRLPGAVIVDAGPSRWVTVVDGDKSDDRWLDPSGVIVGLRAKGRMRKSRVGGMVKEAS